MPELPRRMVVCAGRKRSLRVLNDVEVEIVSQTDDSCIVTCRRIDDGNLIKLKKASLKPKPISTPDISSDPHLRLREEQQQWMTRFRTEILDLEDLIPWNGVIKSWKAKRGTWRKRIVASLTLQDIGEGLKELLRCLVWERDNRIGHSVLKWESEIDEMCSDAGDCQKFSKLWKKLSSDIQKWIQDRAGGANLPEPAVSRRRAELAVSRLKAAVSDGEEAVRQVPLSAILSDDTVALGHVKSLLCGEKRRLPDVTSPRKRSKDPLSAERSAADTFRKRSHRRLATKAVDSVLRPSARARRETALGSRFVPCAEQEGFDFDAVLAKATEKFESADNKPVVIGYGVAAILALLFTEWLIHLPGLDFILGFPIQLLGVLMGPVLILRYLVDKEDWYADAEGTVDKVAGLLPGLKK